jgi:hypothetical protein
MNPLPWRKGDAVRVTFGGRTIDAEIVIASENAVSLAVTFDGILGGYAGMMPILWTGEHYEDLITRSIVTLEACHRIKAERIAPGVYVIDGALHLNLKEMLEANGYPDTPENREVLTRAAHDVTRQHWPDVKIEDV